jgi:hypothetical protein
MSLFPAFLADKKLLVFWLACGAGDSLRIAGMSYLYLTLSSMEEPESGCWVGLGMGSEVGSLGSENCFIRGTDCVRRLRMVEGMRCAAGDPRS